MAVVAPGLVANSDPLRPNDAEILSSPSGAHLLGTDYLGRDLWSRLVYGTVRTFIGSASPSLIGLGVGTVLGLVAAYFTGAVDSLISRLVDVLLSIPGLLLAMVIVVSLGFGTFNAAIAVGVASVAVVHPADALRGADREGAAVRGGEPPPRRGRPGTCCASTSSPTPTASVLSLTALQFGLAILWVSALSFLGYGAPPPEPEWGLLVSEGREYVVSSPWLVFAPGIFITASVLAFSRLGLLVKERLS